MLYLTFHVDDSATALITEWQQEETLSAEGAYIFTFSPQPEGCRLEVRYSPALVADAPAGEEAALQLDLSHCLHIKEDPNEPDDAFRWQTPQLRGAETERGAATGVNEIVFWIDGEIVRRLHESGWEPEQAGAYDYRFHAHGETVDIWVRERGGHDEVHLTANVAA